MEMLGIREKLILIGMYLSKFDVDGLHLLGFTSFTEAFNVVGLALNSPPASIKNYRDEFDPVFPNSRQGWHRRPMREHCKATLDKFGNLGVGELTELVKAIVYKDADLGIIFEQVVDSADSQVSTFAKRLITGQAAEQYFKSNYESISEFQGFELEDTTQLGCGFDFKLSSSHTYCGVEVKGLNELNGTVTLTQKEHAVAAYLKERYFLFIVKNFKDKPFHNVYQNPLDGNSLAFTRQEMAVTQVSWRTVV